MTSTARHGHGATIRELYLQVQLFERGWKYQIARISGNGIVQGWRSNHTTASGTWAGMVATRWRKRLVSSGTLCRDRTVSAKRVLRWCPQQLPQCRTPHEFIFSSNSANWPEQLTGRRTLW